MSKVAAISQGAVVSAEAARLVGTQQDLAAKTGYLQSDTALWSSGAAYKAEVAETSAEIKAFNTMLEGYLPSTSPPPKPQATATAPATAAKKDNTSIYLMGAGIAVAALAALYFAGRKK